MEILDKIIEMELDFLKRKRVPTQVLISLPNFNALIKELDAGRSFDRIHNMEIHIVKSKQLVVV